MFYKIFAFLNKSFYLVFNLLILISEFFLILIYFYEGTEFYNVTFFDAFLGIESDLYIYFVPLFLIRILTSTGTAGADCVGVSYLDYFSVLLQF